MIGIDIVKVSRIEKLIDRFNEKALEKFLNKEEIELVKSPLTAAGFWAAKEAFSKAVGTGIGKELSFKDIVIVKDNRGKPHIKIDNLKEKFNIISVDLSISHDGDYAIAAVIVLKKDLLYNFNC